MIAIEVVLVEHNTQLPKVPGKLFMGPPPVDLSASRTSDQLIRRWLKNLEGVTVMCPLIREAPSSPVKLEGRVSLMSTYRTLEQQRKIRLNPFPMSVQEPPSISSLRTFTHDLVESLQAGKNVFLHGNGQNDRAPLIVAAILRELYRTSAQNSVKFVSGLLQSNEPLFTVSEYRLLDDAYPTSIQYGDKNNRVKIYRQVEHSALREDAGRTVLEWKDHRISTLFVLGEEGPITNFLRRQDFEVLAFPIGEGGILPPDQEVRFFYELNRVQKAQKGEVLLLDSKIRSTSLYLFALVLNKYLGTKPNSAIKSIKNAFPGVEFTDSQTVRIQSLKNGSIQDKEPLQPVEAPAPFHETWTDLKAFSVDPGEGTLSLASITQNLNEMETLIRNKGVTHVLLICNEREAKAGGFDRKELSRKILDSGIQVTHCALPPGDQPPKQEEFEEGIDALIELAIASPHTLLLTTGDLRRAGILIAGSIGRSLALGSNEALDALGFEPKLSPMQQAFLAKYLADYKVSITG